MMKEISKEEIMEILRLLSNIESVIDMKMFREQVPDWIIERLEHIVANLGEKLKWERLSSEYGILNQNSL